MDYVKAFVIGGFICVCAQILLEKTKMMPGRIMVTLVVTGVLLGFFGLYEPFANWAGCGATIPLTGFGNNLYQGVKHQIEANGFIGLFKGGFTSAAVGCSAALIFSYLASLIFQPKMKK